MSSSLAAEGDRGDAGEGSGERGDLGVVASGDLGAGGSMGEGGPPPLLIGDLTGSDALLLASLYIVIKTLFYDSLLESCSYAEHFNRIFCQN